MTLYRNAIVKTRGTSNAIQAWRYVFVLKESIVKYTFHFSNQGGLSMKIAVIGPGSMGPLFGGKLSQNAEVILIGHNAAHIHTINSDQVTIKRDGQAQTYKVPAFTNGTADGPADLIILFTKAYITRQALRENAQLIGADTVILTLQNGAGHEEILQEFVPRDRILLGTTNQGSYRESTSVIVHSGLGETTIGSLTGNESLCETVRSLFSSSGFPCTISHNIRFTVWNKLMINASSSVLSGVLAVRQGYVASDPPSWEICRDLIREICRTAALEECIFDEEEQIERIRRHLENAPDGYTSIYADLRNGRKTEVDFISGHVVRTAEKHGLSVPVQKCIVRMVHAIENRERPSV